MNTITKITSIISFVLLFANLSFGWAGNTCENKTNDECNAYMDSLDLVEENETLAKIPDSLKISLKKKLESDTSFVFYGHVIQYDLIVTRWMLDHKSYSNVDEHDLKIFKDWYEAESKDHAAKLDSLPKEVREIYESSHLNDYYYLDKTVYEILKVYDRSSQSWVEPDKKRNVYSVKKLKHEGGRISSDGTTTLLDEYASLDYKNNRIIFKDGFSRKLELEQLENLSEITGEKDLFIPEFWSVTLGKNRIPLQKKKIVEAVAQNDPVLVEKLLNELDSLVANKPEVRLKGDTVGFERCKTKSLLNAYLGKFNDVEICDSFDGKFASYSLSDENKLDTLLEDYFKKSIENGTLEKSLANLDASKRAFIRIVIQSFIRQELSDVVEANADSIDDEVVRSRLIRDYYQKVEVGNLTSGGSLSGIIGSPLGSGKNPFPENLRARFEVNFFYKNFGVDVGFRSFGEYSSDSMKYVFFDVMFGYRTSITPHIDNIVLVGPSLYAYGSNDESATDDNKNVLGFVLGTAFDFYFFKQTPTIKPYNPSYGVRPGIRVAAGVSVYGMNSDVANKNVFVSLGIVLQSYETKPAPYKGRKLGSGDSGKLL